MNETEAMALAAVLCAAMDYFKADRESERDFARIKLEDALRKIGGLK